ncbi:hypothetical protein [Corynebacterium rhinophilum]|uniref:hypothetical protein n=1 Tax=Corynebacterium rhinophilum TaxID=3050197 RepID=UPI00254AE25D|nr:hypothetical protein [Corynebacterium sp. MSK192]MDK8699165.1 hypothetical protein [Corynebacterium sp. MSK192]
MNVTFTVAAPHENDYFTTVIPAMLDIASNAPSGDGLYSLVYFARTWDPSTKEDILRICLLPKGGKYAVCRRIEGLLRKNGLVDFSFAEELEYPPLWNAGFSGSRFAQTSIAIYEAATRWMVKLASRWSGLQVTRPPLRDAIQTMVWHGRASLDSSLYKNLDGFENSQLLSLRLLSYRSHYEAAYARSANPAGLDRFCSRAYEELGGVARQAVAAASKPRTCWNRDIPGSWYAVVATCHEKIRTALANGDLFDVSRTREDLERALGRELEPTRFHARLTEPIRYLLYQDLDFLAYRFETSLLYSVLYTLGYPLSLRYVLCNLVAQANEDESNKSAMKLREELEAFATSLYHAHS